MEPCLTGRFRLDEGPVRRAFAEQFRTTKTLNLVFSVFCLGIGTYTLIRCIRSGSFGFYQLFPTLFCFAAAGFLLYQAFLVLPRGIRRFLELNGHAPVYVQRNAFGRRKAADGREIGMDPALLSRELDRFENGTEADFWKLMCAVCPDAVPKKYRQGGPAGGR